MKERLFIAIPAQIDDFKALQKDFETVLEGRFLKEEYLHLTVVFLGDVLSAENIIEKMESVNVTFDLSPIRNLGYFDRSKVLVGLCENDSIKALRKRICDAFNIQCNGEYRLHVTLMRVKKIIDSENFENILNHNVQVIGTLQPRLILYRSHLSSEGTHYTIVKEFQL